VQLIKQEADMTFYQGLKAAQLTNKKADYQVRRPGNLLSPFLSFAVLRTAVADGSSLSVRLARLQARLENAGFADDDELDAAIQKIENSIKRARKKDLGENAEPEEEPSYPLVDVPDADLDEEGVKEKRRQKLMKAGYDARIRLKAEKLAEKARVEELERKEEDERINDPTSWAAKIRKEHEVRPLFHSPPHLLASVQPVHSRSPY
jgi:actin-related protein